MPKWWKISFISALLTATGALSADIALKDPALIGEHEAVVAEYKEDVNLSWEWASLELECEIYENCVHIDVRETVRCEEQVQIFVYLTDENDDWVDSANTVIQSPGHSGSAIVEIGVNRDDFEYFMVGDVRCTAALPTVEATL